MSTSMVSQEISNSQRFTEKVLTEFGSNTGEIAVTNFQKRLIQNYFISIDMSLKKAEQGRLKKTKNQDPLPVIWQNINLESLAQDIVHVARLGLDPLLPNHVYFIPYKNNNTNKYDMQIMEGYKGKELKAIKYGLDVPDNVTIELVYSNDTFKPIKKSRSSSIETYDFEINSPFDRGDVLGGFIYFSYQNNDKNKLEFMSIADILKRKPQYASVEFWGGEKDIWKDGKKTGEKEKVVGWFEEMCLKTLRRHAYGLITIDSQKIDDTYQYLMSRELKTTDERIETEIEKMQIVKLLTLAFRKKLKESQKGSQTFDEQQLGNTSVPV